jgi:hypothetical protein
VSAADPTTGKAFLDRNFDREDDMYDPPDDMPSNPLVRRALLHWQTIAGPYWQANRQALHHQRQHRWIANFAAILGALAVILAIFQLAFLIPISAKLEVAAATLAAVAVVFGLSAGFMDKWLVERHRAERIRLLKFRSILELAVMNGSDAEFQAWEERINREMNHIKHELPDRWSEEDKLTDEPSWSGNVSINEDDLRALVDYYRSQRLEVQTDYFFRQARKNTERDSRTRYLPPLLFGLSILFVLGHFLLDSLAKQGAAHELASRILILIAAILPVLAAAIRTYRDTGEFSRNTTRFWAKYIQLELRAGRLNIVNWPDDVLRELWQSESTLEQEHREWLRLMKEAEWFG